MLFSSKGHDVYYEVDGPADGDTVIALHHGLGTTRSWKNQVNAFVDAGFRFVTYDRWGYGKSGPRDGFDLPEFRNDLNDLYNLYDQLEIESAHLLGHSDGGTIALMFAVEYPERVNQLITIAAHIYLEETMEPGIQGIMQTFYQDEEFRGKFIKVHHGKAENLIHTWYEDWHTPAVAGWDIRESITEISSPTLVIQGMEDEHATPQHAVDIAEAIPGAELWLVPGGTHMMIEELEDEINPRLIEFLQPD